MCHLITGALTATWGGGGRWLSISSRLHQFSGREHGDLLRCITWNRPSYQPNSPLPRYRPSCRIIPSMYVLGSIHYYNVADYLILYACICCIANACLCYDILVLYNPDPAATAAAVASLSTRSRLPKTVPRTTPTNKRPTGHGGGFCEQRS